MIAAGGGTIYAVNINKQACNPSVSRNPAFPACMALLNLNQLAVKVPDSLSGGYSLSQVESHDRITIIDTGNAVRWYFMRGSIDSLVDLQCPEWSTHPDYLAFLSGVPSGAYSAYAVRISDKRFLKISKGNLTEYGTPHFWLPDTAKGGDPASAPGYATSGFVEKSALTQFFGTARFKFVYTVVPGNGALRYVDYSSSADPSPVELPKPAGRENEYCASPLISPDGNWVAFHCFENPSYGSYYSSYLQRLSPGAEPILVAEGASDPHWWVDPNSSGRDYYLVYSLTKKEYQTDLDFTNPDLATSGKAGSTILRRLKGTTEVLGSLGIDDAYEPQTIAQLPFKGGLSPDGRFLCTSYKYSYFMKIKEAF